MTIIFDTTQSSNAKTMLARLRLVGELAKGRCDLLELPEGVRGLAQKLVLIKRANEIRMELGAQGATLAQPAVSSIDDLDKPFDSYLAEQDGDPVKAAKALFKDRLQGKSVKTLIGDVFMLGAGFNEMKRGMKSDTLKARLIAYVPEILTGGQYVGREESHKPRNDYIAFHFFQKELEIDGALVTAGVNVGERTSGQFVYVAYGLNHAGNKSWQKKEASSGAGNEPALDACIQDEELRVSIEPSEPTAKLELLASSLPTVNFILEDVRTKINQMLDPISEQPELNMFILKVVDKATGERLTEQEDNPHTDGSSAINAAFDELFEVLRKEQVFEKAMQNQALLDSIFGGEQPTDPVDTIIDSTEVAI
ncbi:MAG: hypothetical protein ACRDDA_06200 [Aeromonas sp.]